jgi:hypothetical protein
MDGIFHDLSRKIDPAKLLGYLNFSDGRPDAKFQKGLAAAAGLLLGSSEAAPWVALPRWLTHALAELESSNSPAFRDTTQARAVLEAALVRLPVAYRTHHADLLAHQPDADLFVPFFLARACEAVLRQGPPWDDPDRLVSGALALLNDYVGYRPIALLETRPNTEYFAHEKVRPVPVYLKGAGVAPGKYADLVRPALELLAKTDPVLLDESSFTPDHLDELAFDPRAHDHFHPVNKRPNVLFGEWDPHTIDNRGFYRRFVLRQMTLDTLLTWVKPQGEPGVPTPGYSDPTERLFEAAAVLAGTILMGAGVSGAGPTYHDSSVTLSKLVPRIARYRDAFYQRLLKALPGPHGERLREEAEKRQQPFAGVRQYLNQAIATQRAAHLQDRRLAQLYAAMGYPTAAREQAAKISAPAVRFGTEVRIRQTETSFAADRGRPADAATLLGEVEDLLRRGIDCGALIDPWNILGYQGLFPIFPGREDTVRDPRAEELIHQIGRQFDLYAKATASAAVAGDEETRERLTTAMRDLAAWWDKFATATVTDLPRVVGGERADAAEHVAGALTAWSQRAPSSNDIGFWRQHREGFTSPAAFAQVIEPLIARQEYRAAMALLMTWLSEGETVPLEEPSASFEVLCERWVRGVAAAEVVPAPARAALVRRFFELLEANANESWLAPAGWLREPDHEDEEEKRGSEFESAYEDMTYKDSADDGEEGSVAGSGEPKGAGSDFPLEAEADSLEERLRFLHAVAKLWRLAARPDLWPRDDTAGQDAVAGWLSTARRTHDALVGFLGRVTAIAVPDPAGGHEGMIEFDRRRAIKGHILELGVSACVETARAARTLAAVLTPGPELPSGQEAGDRPAALAWEPLLIRVERAIVRGDVGGVRSVLPGFVGLFRTEPLLYCPPSDGGKPHEVLRAQTALHVLEDLLTRLPRLGLLRETFQLTKLARQMEWNNPPDGRRVSSFDQLFRTALTGVVETLLSAAADWGEDAGPDGPLSGMLFQLAEAFQELWVQHSQSLRLSVLESVADDDDWEPVRGFVKRYGSDLFTVPFLGLSNMRGILARGVGAWLDHEANRDDVDKRPKLVDDWAEGDLDRNRTARAAEVVLQALVEHYDEYRDYNTTTTQSDYGENIHILLDFLRVKVRYDRYAWRLRPLALAHEVLCRRGNDDLAAKWREVVADKTAGLAEDLLDRLGALETRHGVKLRTIRDRLEERFLLPLEIDQAVARVGPAAEAARAGQGEDNPAFSRLRGAVEPLAENVSGVGLDVPAWVRRLEESLRAAKARDAADPADPVRLAPGVDFEELRRQLADWDRPLGE